mmetsp:Transcript_9788/g.25700  ORF Transcript_9788/g.25700 Transcript_9788/m.25700 type:complete len:315 (+) Transcript_9788:73-1017(+)
MINGMMSSGTGGFNKDLHRQQYEWENELESVDQKQANLSLMQWKLVRHQTGMLAQQLMDVKKEVEEVSRMSELLAARMSNAEDENRVFEKSVKEFVGKLFEKLDSKHTELKVAFEKSVDENQHKHAANLDKVGKLLENHDALKGNVTAFDLEMRKLRQEFNQHSQTCSNLKEQMIAQAGEAKSQTDNLMDHHRKLMERIEDETRTRNQAHDELHEKCREYVDRERQIRDDHHDQLLGHINNVHADVTTCKEDMPALRGKIASMADNVARMQNESIKQLQAQIAEHPKKHGHARAPPRAGAGDPQPGVHGQELNG